MTLRTNPSHYKQETKQITEMYAGEGWIWMMDRMNFQIYLSASQSARQRIITRQESNLDLVVCFISKFLSICVNKDRHDSSTISLYCLCVLVLYVLFL